MEDRITSDQTRLVLLGAAAYIAPRHSEATRATNYLLPVGSEDRA